MDAKALQAAFEAPFDLADVKFLPKIISNDKKRALAIAYIDARVVQQRLDDVFGPGGWQTTFAVMPNDGAVCTLKVLWDGQWVHKEDYGAPSKQQQTHDKVKASFSDALKRAAVHLGIGRYLYSSIPQWSDYDVDKKAWVRQPKLVVPAKRKPELAADDDAHPADEPEQQEEKPKPAPKPKGGDLPKNGAELDKRIRDFDAKLAGDKKIQPGELVNHVTRVCHKEGGFGVFLRDYERPGIEMATDEVRKFLSERKIAS